VATDAFFKPARIFNELDLFQRDPAWLASFPDRADESVYPRGEIYVTLRERTPDSPADTPVWAIQADQFVQGDEHHPPEPKVPPSELLQMCVRADPESHYMGVEAEPGTEEWSLVYYTWADLKMTAAEAKELLRNLCARFALAFPDRE